MTAVLALPCRMPLAGDARRPFFSGTAVTNHTDGTRLRGTRLQCRRAPTTEIVPGPDAWDACPIGWNGLAASGQSIIALLAKTMTHPTMT